MRKSAISAEDFVKTWQSSKNWEDVLSKLPQMKRGSITTRVVCYRKMGIPLKKFPRTVFPLDVAHLKRIAKKALKAA